MKKLVSILIIIIWCGALLTDLSAGQEQSKPSSYEHKQKAEDTLVNQIKQKGIDKDRFKIPDILPSEGAQSGRMTVRGKKYRTSFGVVDEVKPIKLYPKDMSGFTGIDTTAGGYGIVPRGDGSIWCFMGPYNTIINGYSFEGEESDPLTFLLMKKIGLVYLHGKGRVVTKDGKEFRLGDATVQTPKRKSEASVIVNDLINDCLILTLYMAEHIGNPPPSPELSKIAIPLIDKHKLSGAKVNRAVERTDSFEMILVGHGGIAFKFSSTWVEVLLLFIDKRGDFPIINFRNGNVQPVLKSGSYTASISDGTEAMVNGTEYIYDKSNLKWVQK